MESDWEQVAVAERNGGKIMLGFVVRRCAHAIGHDPSPEEFAAWANTYREEPFDRPTHLFGRPITVAEAEVILRNPGRLVRTRLGPPSPGDQPELPQANVAGARVIVLQPRDRLRNAGQK